MVKQVTLDPATATAPLRLWLENNCPKSSEIIALSKEIGNIVWEGACIINNGAAFKRSIEPPLKPGKRSKQKGKKAGNNHGPLVPHKDGPFFGIAGVILRESLNLARGHSCGNEHLGKLARGQHPLTSTRSAKDSDIDHYDPIRHNNQHITLIRKHLGIQKLLTREAICALSVWFSTGQGSQTVAFLKSTDMFFKNAPQAEAAFESAKAQSLQYDNIHVWGQSCTHLTLHPVNPKTKKSLTAQEKLAPFFTKELQDTWEIFLGGMKNYAGDPWDYTGTKQTYDYTLNWVENLGLLGFGPGSLTALQFTNTLAILGFIQPPADTSLIKWIKNRPEKGAYRGLTILGFDLASRPSALLEAYVGEAFRTVHQHFKSTMCAKDLETFGFTRGLGAIFVEHFLCKVVRWAGRFPPTSKVHLHTIGESAQISQRGRWKQGANVADHSGQLFPISMDLDANVREQLEDRLDKLYKEYIATSTL
jgi:hypothetical protein